MTRHGSVALYVLCGNWQQLVTIRITSHSETAWVNKGKPSVGQSSGVSKIVEGETCDHTDFDARVQLLQGRCSIMQHARPTFKDRFEHGEIQIVMRLDQKVNVSNSKEDVTIKVPQTTITLLLLMLCSGFPAAGSATPTPTHATIVGCGNAGNSHSSSSSSSLLLLLPPPPPALPPPPPRQKGEENYTLIRMGL